MASNFLGPPAPPPDIPQVQIPAVKADQIAGGIASGLDKSGFWGGLFAAAEKWVSALLTAALTWLLSVMAWAAAKLVSVLVRVEEGSEGAFNQLAAAALKDLLGVDIRIGDVSSRGGRSDQQRVASDIGTAVLEGLYGSLPAGAAAGLQPSDRQAKRFLTTMTQLAFEGWLEGWMIEALSLGALERFADLDDTLVSALGLGGMSARVLAPYTDILIGRPLEQHLNRLYRPTLLGIRQLIRAVDRGDIPHERARAELALQGYSDERINILLTEREKQLSVEDLDYLLARNMWSREEAIAELVDAGWTPDRAETLLDIAQSKRLDSYRSTLANEAVARYVERDIERDQFFRLIESSGVPARDREMLRQIAAVRRELRFRDLSVSDMTDMVTRGIQGREDLRKLLEKLGYSPADQLHLELLLVDRVQDRVEAARERELREKERAARELERAEIRRQREEEAARRALLGGLNLGQEQDLVRRGIRSIDDYRTFLGNLGMDDRAIEDLSTALAGEMAARERDEQERARLREEARIRQVDLPALEDGVRRGFITVDDYRQVLLDRGFTPQAADLMQRLLEAEIDDARRAGEAREAARVKLHQQRISLDDLERAVRIGIRSIESYDAELVRREFDAPQRELLIRLLQADIAADQAARERRAELERRAAERDLDLGALDKAVRAGVRSIEQYRAELAARGFDQTEVDLLARLVELQLAADQAAGAEKKQARERLRSKPVPLGDLERAVKLGIVTVEQYREALRQAGFALEAVDTLVLLLVTGMRRAVEDAEAREEARRAAAQRGLSLSDLEQEVRLGRLNPAEFQIELQAQGFTAEAAARLRGILEQEIAEREAERRRRAEIAAELTKRGLSLAQFERAVKGGLRALDDYGEFLLREGFSPVDAALLVHLLEEELAAAAAKAAPKG